MKEVKLNNIIQKVNQWLKGHNYRFDIEIHEQGYLLCLYQGTHPYKRSAYRADQFDSRYAIYIKQFIMDVYERDFYECIFGKVIGVRLDIIPLNEHPSDYLARHKYNILAEEPNTIGDCWILTMIDEGLPLTDLMTRIK